MKSLKLASTILALVLMTGCHVGKKDAIRQHENAIATIQEPPARTSELPSGTTLSVDLEAIYNKSKQNNVDQTSEILVPLAKELFSSKIRLDNRVNRQDRVKWALQIFNYTLLKVAKESPKNAVYGQILSRYKNLVLEGCDADSINNCLNFFYLKQDSGSTQVIKLLAKQEKDLKQYYRLVSIAFELSGKRADDELTMLLELRAVELLSSYIQTKRGADGTLKLSIDHLSISQGKEYRYYSNLLATALHGADQKTKVAGFSKSSKTLMSWLASPNYVAVLGTALSTELNALIDDWVKSPEIWDGLVQRMNNWEKQPNSYSHNLNSIPAKLVNRFNLRTLDLVALTKEKPRSRLGFFYLSRLFDLKSSQQERYLWELSDQDRKASVLQIQAILKAAFMAKTNRSHKLMAQTFMKIQSEFNAKSQILTRTIDEAQRILAPEWATFFMQASRLEGFFTSEIETAAAQSSDVEFVKLVKETRIIFNELNSNVKTMVTYPIMATFSYYAAKWDYLEKVQLMDGSIFEINKRSFMTAFFNASIPPLFVLTAHRNDDQSRNDQRLSKVELMTSLVYLFKGEVLEQFGISPKDFLKEVSLTIKAPTDQKLTKRIDKIVQDTKANSPIATAFEYCSLFNSQNLNARKTLDFSPQQIAVRTFLGIPGDIGTDDTLRDLNNKVVLSVRAGENGIDEAIETMRSDIDPQLRWLSLFKGILSEIKDIRGNQEGVDFINQEIKASEGLKNKLLTLSQNFISKTSHCSKVLAEIELSRQKQLMNFEFNFAEDVFTALEILEGLGDKGLLRVSDLQRTEPHLRLFSEVRFKDLESSLPVYKALTKWLADRSNLATAFAAMPFYKQGFEISGGIQRDSTGRYYYNNRYSDFVVRATTYLTNGYNGNMVQPKPDITVVKWPAEKDKAQIEGSNFDGKSTPIYLSRTQRRETRLAEFKFSFSSSVLERTSWFSRIRSLTSIFRFLLKNEAALFKYQFQRDLDIEQISQCKEDCQNKVKQSVKDATPHLIELTNQMISVFSIDDEQAQFMQTLGVDTYFLINLSGIFAQGPAELFISGDVSGRYMGSLDDAFMFITAPLLGYLPKFLSIRGETATANFVVSPQQQGNQDRLINPRTSSYGDAEASYVALRDLDRDLLFPMGDRVKEIVRSLNAYTLNREMLIAAGIEEAAMDWQTQGSPIQFMHFSLQKPRLDRPQLLSAEIVSAYYEVQRVFNRSTGGFYLPEILRSDRRWFDGL